MPSLANSVYAAPDYLAEHSVTGANPTARWVGWGSSKIEPDWRQAAHLLGCRIGHIAADPMAQLAAVREGMGIGFLLCLLGDREPGLVRVPPGTTYEERPGWILTHPDLITSERVRVCVRFLVDALFEHEQLLSGASYD